MNTGSLLEKVKASLPCIELHYQEYMVATGNQLSSLIIMFCCQLLFTVNFCLLCFAF